MRAALGVDKLTLIGVSYGTFLAQAYAARHLTHVERVLLDSVLDVSGWDPFYRDIFGAVPRVLESVCRRPAPASPATRWTTSPGWSSGSARHLARARDAPNGHRRKTA